jgi:hypothetical protein
VHPGTALQRAAAAPPLQPVDADAAAALQRAAAVESEPGFRRF